DRSLDGVPYLPPLGTPEIESDRRHGSLGMTETAGPHTMAPPEMQAVLLPDDLRGSWGPSVPYVEHRIADFETSASLPDGAEGEICVRGYSVMAGMYKREREDVFDADGWYHTGDRGFFRDGLLYFTGRADDQIKTGGSNVAPREVELALEALPEVTAAFVFGIDDDERTQVVVAGVVPTPGVVVDPDALRTCLRGEISVYKVPRDIAVLDPDDVPLLASGKEDRRAVRAAVVRRLEIAR
ncbi:MAG: fatty acid--CoA ligase family protein, partial [Microbacterium sp.]